MTSRRWRTRAALGLAACGLAVAPVAAAPLTLPHRVVVAGPGVSGWVVGIRTRPAGSALTVFVAHPVGPSLVRLVVETCGETCFLDDRVVPGSVEWGDRQVLVRATHPEIGALALTGRLSSPSPGTAAFCTMFWDGSLSGITTTAADYSRASWSGRIGPYAVQPLSGDPCSYAHLAGVLLVS